MELCQNEGKALTVTAGGQSWQRLPLKTKLITDKDDIAAVAKDVSTGLLRGRHSFHFGKGRGLLPGARHPHGRDKTPQTRPFFGEIRLQKPLRHRAGHS